MESRTARRSLGHRIGLMLLTACFTLSSAGPVFSVAPGGSTVETATVATSTIDALTTANLRDVTFVNATLGFAVGTGGTILKTTDAGFTWRSVGPGGTGDAYDFRGVNFFDASNGWVVSLAGTAWRTTNGGESWSVASADISGSGYVVDRFYDVEFLSLVDGWSVGGAQGTPGFGWRTYNGGISLPWESAPPELWAGYYDPGEPNPPNQGKGRFYAVDFPTTSRGWAVGIDEYVTPNKPLVVKFEADRPGGEWYPQTMSGTGALYDVSFANGNTTAGTAVGATGRAYYTTNGGTSWILGTTGVTNDLLGVVMSSASTGWAVGKSGRILKTVNGGAAWTSQTSPTGYNLEAVARATGTTLVAVGDSGTIIRTTDGTTWSAPPEPPILWNLGSTTHQTGVWSKVAAVTMYWLVSPSTGIEGYSYVFDKLPGTTPDSVIETSAYGATVTATSSGVWYFHVLAKDIYGQLSPTVHFSVSIDLAVPTAGDNAQQYYTASPAVVALTASDSGGSGLTGISYRVDGAAPQVVAGASANVSISGEGAHTLEYWATDNAGNTSTPVTRNLRIDITPPAASDNHTAYYTAVPAVVALSATDVGGSGVANVKYSLDGGGTQTVAGSSANVSTSAEGPHTLSYWATDNAGNASTPIPVAYTVDTVRPVAHDDIVATYPGSAVFTLWGTDAGSGPASVTYRLDGAAPVTVASSSTVLTVDTPGSHSVEYWVADAAGNESTPHVTEGFDAGTDSAPPVLSDDVAAYYTASPAVLHLSATDPGSGVAWIAYRLDGATTQTVEAAATTVNVTGEGVHSIVYAAADNLGHVSTAVTRNLRIDTIQPTATSNAVAYYTASPAVVTITGADPGGSGVAFIRWKTDGGGTQSSAGSSKAVSITGEGLHSLEFWSVDAAGNESGHTTVGPRIDVTAPALADDAPANTLSDPVTVHLTATDVGGSGVVSISYNLDGSGAQVVAGASADVAVSGVGVHTLVYSAEDAAGNTSPASTRTVRIDTTAPVVTHDANAFYKVDPAQFTLSATDIGGSGVASIAYRVDAGGLQTIPGASAPVSVSGAGPHTVQYSATDLAGNVTNGSLNLTLDLAKPVLSDNGASTYSGEANITIQAIDTGSSVQTLYWRLDDAPEQSKAGPASPLSQPLTIGPGKHTLVFWAEDRAGNRADNKTVTFTVLASGAERLSDRTRFSTAVAIARESFDADGLASNGTQWTGVQHVVIASGDDRAAADPLAASGLCWAYDAPLFLVSAKQTPGEVKAAIKEIATQNSHVYVHVVGGPASVPDARYSDIATYVGASKLTKDRLLSTGGRYDMAAKISSEMQRLKGKPSVVLVANGADPTKFFDALALSPIASRNGYPILLVTATSIPPATQSRINAIAPSRVIIGGGPNTVSDTVKKTLSAERWYGRSRYDTALEIANRAIGAAMLEDTVAGVAAKLPDALTGGSMVGRKGGVLLLTDGGSLTSVTGSWLATHKGAITACYVFGGANSVSSAVIAQINAKLH